MHLSLASTVVRDLTKAAPSSDLISYSDQVYAFQEYETTDLTDTHYEPAICFILQGAKQTVVDGRVLDLRAGDCVLISHHVPVQARITQASREEPYCALIVKVDMAIIRDLATEVRTSEVSSEDSYSVTSATADERLLGVTERLLVALKDPLEARIIGDAIYRELHLRLLRAPFGGMLREMTDQNGIANGIARAIKYLRDNYANALSVPKIASVAAMSVSAFHAKFRDITGTMPNRYLKSLRLQEAHGFLSLKGYSVTDAAFAVGYKSVNHFSRDYAKSFGVSPSHAKAATA